MKKPIINNVVIITDCKDVAFVEIKQTLKNHLNELKVRHDVQIESCVNIENFSVLHASFIIRLLAEIYSSGTLFLVIVSGTNNSPERIFGKSSHGIYFVGNNSGYFNWMIKDFGLELLCENHTSRKIDGRSFGGKYVQSPTAARIISGEKLSNIGKEMNADFLKDYSIPDNSVVHCDNFGLMKIYSEKIDDLKEGDKLVVMINKKVKINAIYTQKMKKIKTGTWVLFTGSSLHGLPELGRVRSDNSANELGVKVGDIITWNKA